MKIIELAGLDLENGKQFFNTLNSVTNIEKIADFYPWQNFYNTSNNSDQELNRLIYTFSNYLIEQLSRDSNLTIYGKSYGGFIASTALQQLKSSNPDIYNKSKISLSMFALPYRLGYPPDTKVLNKNLSNFDDEALSYNFLHYLATLEIPIIIFQGTVDDLGPISPLAEAATKFANIRVVNVLNEGHDLTPAAVGKVIQKPNKD